MKNLIQLEIKQYNNKIIEEIFIENYINKNLAGVLAMLAEDGSFYGAGKLIFQMDLYFLFQDENYKLIKYTKNYSIGINPSELVHSFTYLSSIVNSDNTITTQEDVINLLFVIKNNFITQIHIENNFIDQKQFEMNQFYN